METYKHRLFSGIVDGIVVSGHQCKELSVIDVFLACGDLVHLNLESYLVTSAFQRVESEYLQPALICGVLQSLH